MPGAFDLGKRTLQRVPAGLFRCRPFGIYEVKLAAEADNKASLSLRSTSSASLQVRWADSTTQVTDIAPLAAAENIRNLDAHTRHVAVAWDGPQPVGLAWVATIDYVEADLGLRYQLAEDEAWLHSAYVDPRFRRQGVYQEMLRFICNDLAKLGYRRVLLGVSTGNRASQQAHAKAGARRIGYILAARSLSVAVRYCSGAAARRVPVVGCSRSPMPVCF